RAMSSAVDKAVKATAIRGDDVRFVVPHQAGSGIVRFTGMKLETLGIGGELINGLTQTVGNISSCSIPFPLKPPSQRLSAAPPSRRCVSRHAGRRQSGSSRGFPRLHLPASHPAPGPRQTRGRLAMNPSSPAMLERLTEQY